jgi:hypothetical protein
MGGAVKLVGKAIGGITSLATGGLGGALLGGLVGAVASSVLSPKAPKQASGGGGGGAAAPTPEPVPQVQNIYQQGGGGGQVAAPEAAPQAQDKPVGLARDAERRRRLRLADENSTLVTGGAGLEGAAVNSGTKSLFGQ